jgi:hypothetical protein
VSTYDRLAELPIEISSYELEDRDREYGDFTRPSTIIHLHGGGQEGLGEDVVYDVLDHIAHRDAGPVLDLSRPGTLGERRPSASPRVTTAAGPTSPPPSTSRCARAASRCTRRSGATPGR